MARRIQRFKYDARGYQSLYNEYKGTRFCRVFKCLITLRTGSCGITAHGGHIEAKSTLCDLTGICSEKATTDSCDCGPKGSYCHATACIITDVTLFFLFINFQIVRLIYVMYSVLKYFDI